MKNATPESEDDPERELRRQQAMAEMRENKNNSAWMTRFMIGANVCVGIIISGFIAIAIKGIPLIFHWNIDPADATCIEFGSAIGLIAWSQILFKTRIFDYCFINVKQNWEVVVGNQITADDIPDDPDKRIELFRRRALRELGQGLRGKWPWEVPVEAVDLRSEIIIGPTKDGKPLECVTSDDVHLSIQWQVVMTPFVGFIVNLIRRNQPALEAYFKGIFDQKIISWVKEHTEKEVFAQLKDLKEVFRNTLGGAEHASTEEMDWGIFTNNPQLISVSRNERYQKAAEGVMIGERMTKVIGQINEQYQGQAEQPDPDLVLAASASLVGNEIPGLFLIPGAGKALASTASQMGAKIPEKKSTKESNKTKGGKDHG